MSYASQVSGIFGKLDVELPEAPDGIEVRSPIDGNVIASVRATSESALRAVGRASRTTARRPSTARVRC